MHVLLLFSMPSPTHRIPSQPPWRHTSANGCCLWCFWRFCFPSAALRGEKGRETGIPHPVALLNRLTASSSTCRRSRSSFLVATPSSSVHAPSREDPEVRPDKASQPDGR